MREGPVPGSPTSTIFKVAHDGERHLPTLDPESTNHYRHMTAYHFVLSMSRGGTILDYGCGTGYGTNFLLRRGNLASLVGVDVSEEAISYCRRSYEDVADVFRLLPPGELPFPESSFSAILLFQVIEHVENDRGLLRKLHDLLVPGGRLFVTTPNVELSGEDPERPSNPFHVREYSAERLRGACASAFAQVEELGIRGSYRVGGTGLGAERWLLWRGLRRLVRALGRPPYATPVSLHDFAITKRRVREALDLLFIGTRGRE
jgi:SAM-dependent methyltransferase